jgi:hypothetical protein
MRGLFLLGLLIATSAAARDLTVGTGWSRAPDLSVYGALVLSSRLAQEQEILCRGRNPARIEDEWRAAYGAREAWIADALRRRYGLGPVARAADVKVGRLTCPTIADRSWLRHHDRVLRLLELRLVPRDHFRRAAP